jgi:hypothetical protein
MFLRMEGETSFPIELWTFVLVAFNFGIQLSENCRGN